MTAAFAMVSLAGLDRLVGGFPGIGACVAQPPQNSGVGRLTTIAVEDVAFWSDPPSRPPPRMAARSASTSPSTADPSPAPACSGTSGCEYAYLHQMMRACLVGEPFDPIVVYHRPPGHPLRHEQAPGQRGYEVEDGHHRISAHLAALRATVPRCGVPRRALLPRNAIRTTREK